MDLRKIYKQVLKGQIYYQTDSPITISYYKFWLKFLQVSNKLLV